MDIGNRIRKRRIDIGLSVDEVAKKLNKNRATIYRYENGEIENVPSIILEQIAKILQTTPAFLLGWDEPTQDNTFQRQETESDRAKKRLCEVYDNLNDEGQTMLMDYTDYLNDKYKKDYSDKQIPKKA